MTGSFKELDYHVAMNVVILPKMKLFLNKICYKSFKALNTATVQSG